MLLATVKADLDEAAKIISKTAPGPGGENGIVKRPFKNSSSALVHYAGALIVDFNKAKVTVTGSGGSRHLSYGKVETTLHFDTLEVVIAWNDALGIPKEIPVEIDDPCGDVLYKDTVHLDLGVSTVQIVPNPLFPDGNIPVYDLTATIIEPHFEVNPKDDHYYMLAGYIAVLEDIEHAFVDAFTDALFRMLRTALDNVLHAVLGNGDLANIIIGILEKIVDIAASITAFIRDELADLVLDPIDDLLVQIFSSKLLIVLDGTAVPKQFELMKKTDVRPAVTIPISKPPRLTPYSSGLTVEVFE
jgi:hypothetical protein